MRILVTGAAGFIGSYLVDDLVNKNHEVIALDDLSGGYEDNIHPKSRFYKIDLRNKQETINLIKKIGPAIIYHLAADATEGRSQFTPISCTQQNFLASLHVLVAAVQAKSKRFVFTSSMSVYGNQRPPFNESMPRKPVDIYGTNKAATEAAIEVFSKIYNLDYAILRLHNVYGPRQNMADPYRNVIAIFINRLLQGKHFFIYGNGNQKRSFSYIDDLTSAISKAGFLKKAHKQIINVGPTQNYTINEVAKEILAQFIGKRKKIPQKLKPAYLPERPAEVKHAYCTDKKARLILGFKHKTSLKNGLAQTIKWANKLGPQKFRYLKNLELNTNKIPTTWKNKLI